MAPKKKADKEMPMKGAMPFGKTAKKAIKKPAKKK